MAKLPYIFIFDIDNCIIGDVTSVIDEYTILGYIRKNCKKNKITDKCSYNINFEEELEKGLLRPHVNDFIDFIKKNINHLNYIYTLIQHIVGLMMDYFQIFKKKLIIR